MGRFRGMSDGEREMWNEQQRDAAPDVRLLWHKRPVARKPHLCDHCNDEIAPGTRYESIGLLSDGTFQFEKLHLFAHHCPSGCPRFRNRERAELEAQFKDDAKHFGGGMRPDSPTTINSLDKGVSE